MEPKTRYGMPVDHIGQDEIDLLECLIRIDQQQALDPRAGDMCERLIESGLVDSTGQGLRLTHGGIERCRSLQHRLAGDRESAKVLASRGIALAMASGMDDEP